MPSIPRRLSLIQQTAESLRAEISLGTWRDWLPGERELTTTLVVGRNTLRAALRELAASGLIETRHGAGHRILRTTTSSAPREMPRSIGLLVPGGLHLLRPSQTLWIDQLRALLIKQGFDLQIHHQRRFPQDPLRHACWVLTLCEGELQRRFARNGIRCVIAGTTHPGVNLPFVDIDYRSLCRHAAGVLIAHGHRRIAFLTRQPRYGGDRESELGFTEGARRSSHSDVVAHIVRHQDSRAGVNHALRRILRGSHPPTALLVGDSHHYLTASSLLARLGKIVPQDLALICRDDDPFLAHLVPAPARYTASPSGFARSLLKLILRAGMSSVAPTLYQQPRLIKGETLRELVP